MNEPALATYILMHYGHLLTLPERTAQHILVLGFPTRPSELIPDVTCWDEKLLEEYGWGRDMEAMAEIKDTSEVRAMVALGEGRFNESVVERVLREHGEEVLLNRCPRCDGLCRTPQARQCFRCGHDWH